MKDKKSRFYVILILTIVVFMIILIPFFIIDNLDNELINVYIQYFGIIGALGGIIAIYSQIRREKLISEGKFIYSLYDGFSTNQHLKDIYHKLEKCKNNKFKKNPFDKNDLGYVIDYLTFFETMFLLIERKIIKIDLIDELFTYRFFVAVHNPFVQNQNLIKYNTYYKNTYRLHKLWVDYRMKKGYGIPFYDYQLDEMDKDYKKIINDG